MRNFCSLGFWLNFEWSPKDSQFCTPLTGCPASVFSNIFSLTAFLQASFSSLFLCMSNFLHLNTFFLFHFILLIYFFQTGYNMIVALQSHSHPTSNIRMVCDLSFPAPQAMTDRWMKDKGRFNHNSETENHWCQTDRIQFHVCDWLTHYLNLSRN